VACTTYIWRKCSYSRFLLSLELVHVVSMQPLANVTALSRRMSGDIPPQLVVSTVYSLTPLSLMVSMALKGASTTALGENVYLYVCLCQFLVYLSSKAYG
jgi:hypothetical protein